MSARRWGLGLFCVSAALLGYELLVMRLLSLAEWGHFAGFVISVAMLGLAASGLFLHFFRERVAREPKLFFSASSGLFALSSLLAFLIAQAVAFTPFLLAWSAREYFLLGLRILLFFVPLFCSGVAIGTPFVARVRPAPQLYFWNMLGSAAPGLLLCLCMAWMHPRLLLLPGVALAAATAAVMAPSRRAAGLWWVGGLLVGIGLVWAPFRYSPYKDLSKTLTLPETRILAERFDPKGVVHQVESPLTRYFPGLSLNFTGALPRSELIFVDGSGPEIVFDPSAALREPEFLRRSPEAFAFQLVQRPTVLVVESGSTEILRALADDAQQVIFVDDLSARIAGRAEAWQRLGGAPPLLRQRARQVQDDARHYLASTGQRYDLILLSLLGSHAASTAGAASLNPAYLFTVEGLAWLLEQLAPGGQAVLTAWVENPPRSGLRLAALLIEVLRRRGVTDPAAHLLVIRSWSTLTFFVGAEPYSAETIRKLKAFCDENSFDLVHFAGIGEEDLNRFNIIAGEPYHAAVQNLLGPRRDQFYEQSPFEVRPPSDVQPFFGHYFRWQALPEFVSRMGTDWIPFVEWGYLVQVASLLVAFLLGVGLLIVPCFCTRSRPTLRYGVLFFSLGVAYMFVELWAIYRLTHLLSSGVMAAAVVLSAMLAASGAGAMVLARRGERRGLRMGSMVLLGAALWLAWWVFPMLERLVFPQTLWIRVLVAALWVAAPAFFMGFPFPFALDHLKRSEEIPWALALNGFGSVLGSLAATLVAVHLGLNALVWAAAGLYAAVLGTLPRR